MTYAMALTIPTLTTDRLILREPRESDFTAMLSFNDSPRASFVGGGRDRQWVWRGLLANIGHWVLRGYGLFSVETKAGDFIGRIGMIYHDGWDEPELGWHLFDGFEGLGYGVEAARAARDDYYARITSHPPISYIDPENPRSEALARRLGATPEREAKVFGKWINIWRHPAPEALA
jgi:RimJ/RimL family protein N-acetyltransferase